MRSGWKSGALLAMLVPFAVQDAEASFCALDHVPAATVLVPYFEVDLADDQGVTTWVHLYNSAPEATLAKVTFWTDWSVPTVNFDVFLTGYDVVRLDLRDVFAGNIPITADEQSDPGDAISPHGEHPEWDGSFSFCQDTFQFLSNPAIVRDERERLVDGHSGQPVAVDGEELCFGQNHGDQVARGYLTIDDTVRCAASFPSEPGYFGGTDPVASNDNQLWAEVWLEWPSEKRRASASAVHLEAMAEAEPGTFYERYSGGADLRERLPTRWGARAFAAIDEWVVWRDGGATSTEGYDCQVGRQALPMNGATCFDQAESLTSVCQGETCLPLESQKVAASTVSSDNGWCDLDLSSVGLPGQEPSQAWVGVLRTRDTVGDAGLYAGVVLGGQCVVSPTIFEDGFESSDTEQWSVTVGGAP